MKPLLLGCAVLALAGGVSFAQQAIENFTPLTEEAKRNPDPANWAMYRANYQNYGYSPLDLINKENVGTLQLVWSRAMEPGFNEVAPIVWNGVMFYANAGDVIQAVNAENGDLIWEYRRQLPDRKTLNQLGERRRGIALDGDKIYFVSWDNFVVALDAKTGQLVWETDRGQAAEGVSNSTGPIVIDGVVVAGSTCQYSGFGCYATGHDATNGEELWRNTFIPKPGEPGDETWGGSPFEARWMTGAWGQFTYDPDLDLVFYGSTGVGPASETQRGTTGGTLQGTNTRFAVKPKTGEIVWRHQVLPRDNWDQECTFEMMPITTDVTPNANAEGMLAVGANASGTARKTLTGVPCKTGTMWSFDAATGEFLYAKQTSYQDIISKIDDKGLVTVNEEKILKNVGEKVSWCPSHNGGRDWAPSSYNPNTNVLFVPVINICQDSTPRTAEPTPKDVYHVDSVRKLSPGKENAGRVDAINVATGDTLWTWETYAPTYAPVLSTGGGLVFTGGLDRYFRALDQDTGKEIWKTRLPAAAQGHQITYTVNGRQYVAVSGGGGGGVSNLAATPGVDAPTGANAMFVFSVPVKTAAN